MTSQLAPSPLLDDRQTRRKAETRRRLLGAARALFADRGYDATRPQDIAREAGVAVGTFYLYFGHKREAFLAFTEEVGEELMAGVREAATPGDDGDFESRLYSSLEALLTYSDENPGCLGAAFADAAVISAHLPEGASLRDRLAQSLALGLQLGAASGELVDDFDTDLIAHGIVGLVQQVLVHGDQRELDRRVQLENLTRFCARALRSERSAL